MLVETAPRCPPPVPDHQSNFNPFKMHDGRVLLPQFDAARREGLSERNAGRPPTDRLPDLPEDTTPEVSGPLLPRSCAPGAIRGYNVSL